MEIKGINILAGFALKSSQPLDARSVVNTLEDLSLFVSNEIAYAGMTAYVNSDDTTKGLYVYNGEIWKPVATSMTTGDIEIPDIDLTGYATEDYVDNAITKLDLSDYVKADDLPDISKFITEIPSEYITESELDSKGYLTEHQPLDAYAKSSELFSKSYLDLTNVPTFSGTVTKEVGGISKGKTYDKATIETILKELLFPHVSPTFSRISLSESSGTYEYGDEVTVSKVTPYFTLGSDQINSIKIGTSVGGSDLYSGNSATNGVTISLTTNKTFDGKTGGTIYCSISDGTDTKSVSASIGYSYYTYYAVTNNTSEPTKWTPLGSDSVAGIELDVSAGQYVWIAADGSNSYSGICTRNDLSGAYNAPEATTKLTKKTLKNSNDYTCTEKYTFYRLSNALKGSGKTTFKLQ